MKFLWKKRKIKERNKRRGCLPLLACCYGPCCLCFACLLACLLARAFACSRLLARACLLPFACSFACCFFGFFFFLADSVPSSFPSLSREFLWTLLRSELDCWFVLDSVLVSLEIVAVLVVFLLNSVPSFLLDFVDCDRFQWWIVVVTASAIDELEAFSIDSVLI